MANEAILQQRKWLHYKLQFTGRMLMKVEWVDGFEIKAVAENGEIVISANREGLL